MNWPWKRKAPSRKEIPELMALAAEACRRGEERPAVRAYKRVLAADPDHLAALVNLGALFSRHPASVRESLVLMEKARRLDPGNQAVLLNLSALYAQTGELDRAWEALGDLEHRDPHYPDLLYNKAHLQLREGKKREAFLSVQEEARRNPSHVNARILQEQLRKILEEG